MDTSPTRIDPEQPGALPRHVAIIMDGNGRWAGKQGLLRHLGHRAGVKPVKECVRYAAERGVECLTLFAFSSENFERPREEVSSLMTLFLEALDREVSELHANQVRLTFVGALEKLSSVLHERMHKAVELTRDNTGLRLNVAVAYGGRWDIANAVRSAISAGVRLEDLDEDVIAAHLQLAEFPELDLLIRTGGEMRVSNFLLWQLAYSELYFTETYWPDFTPHDFEQALEQFKNRQRRRGKTGEQVSKAKC